MIAAMRAVLFRVPSHSDVFDGSAQLLRATHRLAVLGRPDRWPVATNLVY